MSTQTTIEAKTHAAGGMPLPLEILRDLERKVLWLSAQIIITSLASDVSP